MNSSKIVVCSNVEFAATTVLQTLDQDGAIVKTFFTDEFKVENAAAVIKEAYIAEEREKIIVLSALEYNVYAQNALLKLFEEPPEDTYFILISRSKNSLLPTIRSRMPSEVLSMQKSHSPLDLDISKLDLSMIFSFLKENQNLKKDELLRVIEKLFIQSSVNSSIEFTQSELELFDVSFELAQLNTRAQNILSLLLLTIYEAKTRKR